MIAMGRFGFLLDGSDRFDSLPMIVVRTVAEIQPKNVDAGLEKIAYYLGRRTRWPESRDNFCHMCASHE